MYRGLDRQWILNIKPVKGVSQFYLIFKIVNIKWNGKQVENIKACEGQQISFLKRRIEDTCGVPAKKQKLLFKGKFLKVFILYYFYSLKTHLG